MGATLDALHRLQEIELQIAEIQQRIDRKHSQVVRQKTLIDGLDVRIRSQTAEVRADQVEADRLDLEVKSGEANIAKLRQTLNSAKTNKEYSAILTQLNTTKADNGKTEEQALVMMNRVEEKKAALTELQKQREEELGRLADHQAAVAEVEAKSRERLDRLRDERREAEQHVPPQALEFFNRVARKNEGEAMAMVIRTHPKREEYACDGCNMTITLEQVNAILSRDEAILCNICGRILYMEAPTASSSH